MKAGHGIVQDFEGAISGGFFLSQHQVHKLQAFAFEKAIAIRGHH